MVAGGAQRLRTFLLIVGVGVLALGLWWLGSRSTANRVKDGIASGQATPTPSPAPTQESTPAKQIQGAATSPSPSPGRSPTPSPSPPTTGFISGKVDFPSEMNPTSNGLPPNLLICAIDRETLNEVRCADHSNGMPPEFKFNVTPGTYYVAAHLKGQAIGPFTPKYKAWYNQFVVCRRTTTICDPSLHTDYIPVTVVAGETTEGVEPTDWYGPEK